MSKLELAPTVLDELRTIIQTLLPSYEVWVFGSRLKHQAHSGSDLDLVIRNPVQLESPCRQLTAFKTALMDSNIPILIDVVDWARIPESFREEILREHEIFFR